MASFKCSYRRPIQKPWNYIDYHINSLLVPKLDSLIYLCWTATGRDAILLLTSSRMVASVTSATSLCCKALTLQDDKQVIRGTGRRTAMASTLMAADPLPQSCRNHCVFILIRWLPKPSGRCSCSRLASSAPLPSHPGTATLHHVQKGQARSWSSSDASTSRMSRSCHEDHRTCLPLERPPLSPHPLVHHLIGILPPPR